MSRAIHVTIICLLIFSLLAASVATMSTFVSAATRPDYGPYEYSKNRTYSFKGDLRPTGLGNPDQREAWHLWHKDNFIEAVNNSLNGVTFDLRPDPSKGEGEWDLSRKSGYHVVPWQESAVKMVVAAANGNPEWVWSQGKNQKEPGKNEPIIKSYTVAEQYEWVDFGSLVRLSGGGRAEESRTGDGVSAPLFTTQWKTTPWPIINSIKFNGTEVARNITKDNNTPLVTNYIHTGGPLVVTLTQTVYGVNPTRNILEVWFDGFKEDNLSRTLGAAVGPYQMNHTFTITNPASLQPGTTHEVKFWAKDDFGRDTAVTIRYTVQIQEPIECDPATSGTIATLKPSGGSSQQVPSMGSYQLPQGSDKVTLTFSKPGTLKVNGVSFGGTSTSFTVPISGETAIYFESTDKSECWLKTVIPTVPDDECDPATSSMQMTIDVWGPKTDKRVTLASGGFYSLERDVDTLQFWPGVKGTYYKNGILIAENQSTFALDVSVSQGGFTIKFVAQDGRCWEVRFGWKSEGPSYSCPSIEWRFSNDRQDEAESIKNGGTLYFSPKDRPVRFDASYTDEKGAKRSASVFWHVKTPSGRIIHYDKETSPYLIYDFSKEQGTYEIWISFDPRSNQGESWLSQGCDFKFFVVVADHYLCANYSVVAELGDHKTEGQRLAMTGSGTASDPFVVQLPMLSDPNLEITFRVYYNGEQWYDTGARWTVTDKNGNDIGWSRSKDYLWAGLDQIDLSALPYLITVEYFDTETDCKTYIKLVGAEANCQDFHVTALVKGNDGKLNEWKLSGRGTQANPYVLTYPTAGRVQIDFQIKYGSAVVAADWEITKDGTTETHEYRNRTLVEHVFYERTPSSYTVKATIKRGAENCQIYIKINFDPKDCDKISIKVHGLRGAFNYDRVPIKGGDGSYENPYELDFPKEYELFILSTYYDGNPADSNYQLRKSSFKGALLEEEWTENEFMFFPKDYPNVETFYLSVTSEMGEGDNVRCPAYFVINIVDGPPLPPNPEDPSDDPGAGDPPAFTPPGGDLDGGQIEIRIYDSQNRLLQADKDGVWEREPARIEVVINQNKIDQAFAEIDRQIQQAIDTRVTMLENHYSGADYEQVQITVSPPQWNAKTSPLTQWPDSIALTVDGPGTDQSFTLKPKLQTQSHQYTGTIRPTTTTWGQALLSEKYRAAVEGFVITAPYQIELLVSFEQCKQSESGDKTCTPGTYQDALSGRFTITVQGNEAFFEVYEPNARGWLAHTAEWAEYHARDRYPNSQPNDFYAGERILTRVQLDPRHRHPYSGQYPAIVSATAWISEKGRQSDALTSTLTLKKQNSTLWTGPMHTVDKLGPREMGVDTPLMGDKQRGFAKDGVYAVYFTVQFGFGVQKGYVFPNKSNYTGHDQTDYRAAFRIIANAWERQGIRNHTTQ